MVTVKIGKHDVVTMSKIGKMKAIHNLYIEGPVQVVML